MVTFVEWQQEKAEEIFEALKDDDGRLNDSAFVQFVGYLLDKV